MRQDTVFSSQQAAAWFPTAARCPPAESIVLRCATRRALHAPGVIRAIPIGIAYREAPQEVLRGAVDAAMQFTHPTEQGSEGAVVIAAAVAWLLK